ncbi:MAG: hypothetical protein CM15mP102_21970 [Flavobacteriales bacterium]|nr:MAG: hypothetical protein CM15mP102_21970 [Flavobacteriales bacterium]
MSNPFETLKSEMDELVVGHTDVKTALLLGVVAREHIYIQGPPGTAKPCCLRLYQNLRTCFLFTKCIEDTRLSELVVI